MGIGAFFFSVGAYLSEATVLHERCSLPGLLSTPTVARQKSYRDETMLRMTCFSLPLCKGLHDVYYSVLAQKQCFPH